MSATAGTVSSGWTPWGSVREEVPELVRSYRGDVIDMMLRDEEAPTSSSQTCSPKRHSGGARGGSLSPAVGRRDQQSTERLAAQRAAREATIRAREEDFRRRTERRAAEAAQQKEEQFQSMYADVLEGLSNTTGIMGDTQYSLEHNQRIKNTKKQELYDEWNTQVFDKMQQRLQGSLERQNDEALRERLSGQMEEYIHTTNTKLGVFRDVICEEEYNPLLAAQHTIRIPTGDIRDPLKRDLIKTQEEQMLMSGGAYVQQPLGKHMLSTLQWGKLQIKSTPYGHCMDADGNYDVKHASEAELAARKSRVPMDHYDYPNRDNAVAAAEMGRQGKATAATMAGAGPGLFGVLQQTASPSPSAPDQPADRWLDYKGRGVPPAEMRRGRRDLSEHIQQTSNPYVDGRSLGDQWLEQKGKSMPAGPEQRRGRANLNEIIQQSSNAYVDGRSLGDMWLEQKGKRPIVGKPSEIRPVISSSKGAPEPVVGGKRILPAQHTDHLVAEGTMTTKLKA